MPRRKYKSLTMERMAVVFCTHSMTPHSSLHDIAAYVRMSIESNMSDEVFVVTVGYLTKLSATRFGIGSEHFGQHRVEVHEPSVLPQIFAFHQERIHMPIAPDYEHLLWPHQRGHDRHVIAEPYMDNERWRLQLLLVGHASAQTHRSHLVDPLEMAGALIPSWMWMWMA